MVYRALLWFFLSALLWGCSPLTPSSDAPSTDDTPRIVADPDPTDPSQTTWNDPLPDGYGQIPLVVWLCSDGDYQGTRITVLSDATDLARFNYAERAMSAAVMRGPGYDAYVAAHGKEPTVTLFAEPGFQGTSTTLKVGCYPTLNPANDPTLLESGLARSLRFNDPEDHPIVTPSINSNDMFRVIPLVIEAYEGPNFSGRAQVHVVTSENLVSQECVPSVSGRGDVPIFRAHGDPDIYWNLHVVDTVYFKSQGERTRHQAAVYTTLPEQTVSLATGGSVLLPERTVYNHEVYDPVSNTASDAAARYDDTWTMSDNRISSLRILAGPDYDSATPSKVNLWSGENFSGTGLSLGVGSYDSLGSQGFDNRISSIQIVP